MNCVPGQFKVDFAEPCFKDSTGDTISFRMTIPYGNDIAGTLEIIEWMDQNSDQMIHINL